MTLRGVVSFGALAALVGVILVTAIDVSDTSTQTPNGHFTAVEPRKLVQGVGFTEPRTELRRLSFEIDGVIAECLAAPGQRVSAGDVLMRLQADEKQSVVAAAQAELRQAQAELDQLLSGSHPDDIAAAERLLEVRNEQLAHAVKKQHRIATMTVRNVATQDQIDDAETAVRQAELYVAQQEAVVRALRNAVRDEDRRLAESGTELAKARLQVAEKRLELCTLRAPFDGTILDVLKRPGDVLRMGDTQPAILFGDLSELMVRAEIDERYVQFLREGQAAEIFGPTLGERRYAGVVSLIEPVMGPKTVFTGRSGERKDLDIVEILVKLSTDCTAPIGLRVDVAVDVTGSPEASAGTIAPTTSESSVVPGTSHE